jgi:hypothetical protein
MNNSNVKADKFTMVSSFVRVSLPFCPIQFGYLLEFGVLFFLLQPIRISHQLVMAFFIRRTLNLGLSVLQLAIIAEAADFPPTYHFVPQQNWMNEPNGLIKIGSTWHLFFQHNPTGNF